MNNLITLNKISKSFLTNKKILVLKKINYKFRKGKIYSLVGPSGSGKSTLLNILSLIDKPTVGSVKIDDIVVNYNDLSINDKIRAKRIGIIYQQNNLLPDFTALENVYLARLSIDDNKKIRSISLAGYEFTGLNIEQGQSATYKLMDGISSSPSPLTVTFFCGDRNWTVSNSTISLANGQTTTVTLNHQSCDGTSALACRSGAASFAFASGC